MKSKARLEKIERAIKPAEDNTITVILDGGGDTLTVNGVEVRREDYQKEHAGDPPQKTIIVSGQGKQE